MSDPHLIESLWEIATAQTGVERERLQMLLAQIDLEDADARTKELYKASQRAVSGLSTESTRFPSLSARIMNPMKKNTIEQYLRELGTRIQQSTRLVIGGSSALILQDLLSRGTEDVDVVDEVPLALREMHEWRAQAKTRYGLYIAHFQSHYLPKGWAERLHSKGRFGKLEVFLVDPVDIFVGKMFSRREKDLDDLRALASVMDRRAIDFRLQESKSLLSDKARRGLARDNYYIVFGDGCPV